jgi:two-component system, cell cycle sensor histidine kinase and response regulator CckA
VAAVWGRFPDPCRDEPPIGRIDILVTAVVMPGLGGHALATALGRDRPGLKVLLVSGYDGGTSLEQGAVSFLAKPYRTKVLLRKVREVLDER